MDFVSLLSNKYKIHLSEQQRTAVENIHGACLLLSVPGGGKTTVIVSRIANMILNVNIPPEKILTLTFSRASALDMKNRFDTIFGQDISKKAEFSTIHSFCYSVINDYVRKNNKSFPILIESNNSGQSKNQILNGIHLEINKEYLTKDKLEELSNNISYVKNMLLKPDQIEMFDTSINNFREIYNSYEKVKRDKSYIDYDDMLSGTYRLFQENEDLLNIYREKYQYVNVDESQDTSFAQHEIIRLLTSPKNNIFMVGDEDQSIYGFRAAFPQALLDFKKTFSESTILLMERNYRSTKCIVNAANYFVAQNKERYAKNMFTQNEYGNPIKFINFDDRNEQYVHLLSSIKSQKVLSQCAILFRNNISAISLVDFLEKNDIAFYIRESSNNFFGHWILNDIISFIKFGLNGSDIDSFAQIYYKMNAYISKNMLEFVTANYTAGINIFDLLLTYPGFLNISNEKDSAQKINSLKRTMENIIENNKNIKRIPIMTPFEAIVFIENNLKYKLFIHKFSKEKGNSPENLNQILDSIKNIASKTENFEDFFNRLSHLQKVFANSKKNKHENAVVLSTIHSCKGLEFDNVYMLDLIDGQFPSSKSISEFEKNNVTLMEEDVRLFYVGITRARKHLEIITFSTSNGRKIPPSRFVLQLLNAQKKVAKSALSRFFSQFISKISSKLKNKKCP